MLLGGLIITQQIGGVGSSIAGKGLDWAKKVISAPGKGLALGGKTLAGYGIDKLHQKTGVDLNVARVWSGIQDKRKDIKAKRYGEGVTKAADAMREGGRLRGALAMTGTPGSAWEQLTTKQGWGARFRGGKKSKAESDKIAGKGGLIDQSQAKIEALKNDPTYKKDVEKSESLTQAQVITANADKARLEGEIMAKDVDISNEKTALGHHQAAGDSIRARVSQEKIDKLEKEKETKLNQHQAIEETLKKPQYTDPEISQAKIDRGVTENKIQAEEGQKKIYHAQALKYKPVMDFEAIAMQGSLESAETKKFQHIEDREELSSMLRDAKKNGDKNRFNAIALKLAHDGNGNDGVLNNLGFSSDAAGLQDLVKSLSNKEYKDKSGKMVKSENYMGYTDQEAKALGMKFSYAEESVNHWGTARAFTMENGRYRDSTTEEQALASASEVAKMDPQMIARSLNRLGFGGETPDGKFLLGDYGVTLLKTIGPKLVDQLKRLNPNIAARLVLPENLEIMVNAGIAPELINGLQSKSQGAGSVTVLAAIEDLKKKTKPGGGKYFP